MADYTTTTNLSLKKPAIGGSSDKWGEYINSSLDDIDSAVGSLQAASTSRSLESLNNVLDATPSTGQLLQYDTANWKAATVTIPDNIQDLTNVTVTSPADGQVLAYSTSNSRWENQTPGAATIPDGTITNAKLDTSLQGQVALILQTTGTPTDNQVLQYNSTDSNWEFVDLPGGNISTLSDTDVSSVALGNALMYNASGDWEARDIVIADVTNLQTTLNTKLESSDLSSYVTTTSLTTTLGSYVTSTTLATELADYTETASLALGTLNNVTNTSLATNDFLVYDAVDGAWENQTPTNARTALGLGTIATQDSDDVTITGGNISGIVDLAIADGGTGASSVSAARTNLGLGTAATTDSTDYATAAQGTLAATATQPGDLATTLNVSATDKLLGRSTAGAGAVEEITLTAAGRALLDDADAAAQRTTLGLGTAATTAATDYATSTQGTTADNALQDVSDDTTPQLGGNLDVVTYSIVSTSARDINITPDTTGNVVLGNFSFDADQTVGLSEDNYVLTYDNSSGQISLEAVSVTESQISDFGNYQTADQALTDISGLAVTDGNFIVADGTNWVAESGATVRTSLGLGTAATTDATAYATSAQGTTADNALQDVSDDTTPQLGGNLDVNGNSIVSASAGNISITPDTTGKIILDGLSWPTADGSADQVLKTDGSGNLSFVDQSSGGGSGTSYIEHSSTVSDSLAISSGTNRMYIGNTSFSGSGTMAGYLVISHGFANFTNASALNLTGTLRIIG